MATAHTMMRAIRVAKFGGPEVLKLCGDVIIPSPAESQVLVKVHSIGVNPVDTYIRSGNYARLPESMPYTPGGDLAGTVHQIGTNVKNFQPGDRVYALRTTTGAYAEFALTDEQATFRLHDSLSFHQGAALPTPYFTAFRALHSRGDAKPGETVLVHGASGAVGSAACQFAKAHGCRVFGTAGSQRGMDFVMKNGATKAFDHTSTTYTQDILEATDGQGVDIVIEMLANVNLQRDLELLCTHGRVIIVGSRGNAEITPRLTMAKETDIRGVMLGQASPDDLTCSERLIYAGAEAGWLRPLVGQQYSLENAAEAHVQVMQHDGGTVGKIILAV